MSSTGSLKHLKDFEWASVARYVGYIASIAGSSEINANHVVSFPLARLGPDKLLKQKKRVLALLEANRAGIERFVGNRRSHLDENELAVLRTVYLQYKSGAEMVRRHIVFLEDCVIEAELTLLRMEEAGQDDLLF